jgi:hypothetical protein
MKNNAADRMTKRGPDFLVIGAQRSGTSWLYFVLRRHPSLWLPPVKEIHYFDKLKGTTQQDRKRWRRALTARQRALNWWTVSYLLGQKNDDWYAKLFYQAQSRGRLAGEITPAYATLNEAMFRHIQGMNPEIKLVFIMRDPVDRAWSAVTNAFKNNRLLAPLTVEKALARARTTSFAARSAYIDTIARLERVFCDAQLHFCFYDELREQPDIMAARLLAFLGVRPHQAKNMLVAKVNSSAGLTPMPPAFQREMARVYIPMVRNLSQRFDGPPQKWLERYERLLDAATATPSAT